ncbi:MAG: MMPL family transporter [Campylobacteraceae bacterium]|jgi:predicted RND superfamily exporter protein|nr:MMPL family transporter [Campylobacteraceae bacterium]
MLKKIYESLILKFPIPVLSVLFIIIAALAYQASKLEVDASAETLLLEDDADLQFMRETSKRYPSGLDMLIISFAPNNDLLSDETLHSIDQICEKLKNMERVDSVMSILNVPLLENGSSAIKELVNDVTTLRSPYVNLEKAREELLTSPIYSENFVSKDLKTTSIVVMLKADTVYIELLEKRNQTRLKAESNEAVKEDKEAFAAASNAFKNYRDELRLKERRTIEDIREILKEHKDDGSLFLGGVNMIAVDMIHFVKSDLTYFGAILFLLLTFVLWIIFRQIRYVVLPLLICAVSIVSTAGILGFFGWEVTVISSNFVALQLILTISIVLHLTVRYRELAAKYPKVAQKELVLLAVLSKAKPSFFAVFTTIIGFLSLMLSSIKPVINFGWMMASGITMSLIIAFTVFPAILVILPKKRLYVKFEKEFAFSSFCAKIVEKHGFFVVITATCMVIFALAGIQKIRVENSFINYFKPSTQIYQGMKNIDQNLGGTTPMDVIVHFNEDKNAQAEEDDFEVEFAADKNDPKYWFTPKVTNTAMRVHDYFDNGEFIGKVQSLGTLLKVGERLNNGRELDSFELALIYTKLPKAYKDMILSPYINIENNELRFTMRLIDSDPNLKRNELIQKANEELKGIITPDIGTYRLSGAMVLYNNMLQSLFKSQILTLGVVALTFLIIFIPLFRSFRASLLAILSNLIPMGVVFGFMGFIGIPLDMMTITVAAISIGMGVDNVIHYIHRFKEELRQNGGDYTKAMHSSHDSIGYAMYYTTISTALGFGVLIFSNFMPTIYFGMLTVAVMIMVFFGAIILLPKLLLIFKPFDDCQNPFYRKPLLFLAKLAAKYKS